VQKPELSCGVFLGYRILHAGHFCVYIGCVEGIMEADLNDLIDFADNTDREMMHIFVFVADSDVPEMIYHRSINRWDMDTARIQSQWEEDDDA